MHNRDFSDINLLLAALPNLSLDSVQHSSLKNIINLIKTNLSNTDYEILKNEMRIVLPYCIKNIKTKPSKGYSSSITVNSFIQHFKNIKQALLHNEKFYDEKTINEIKECLAIKDYAYAQQLINNYCIEKTYDEVRAYQNLTEDLISYCIHYAVLFEETRQTEKKSTENIAAIKKQLYNSIENRITELSNELL
ncbi:MAG: hypothetical protein ACK4K9_07685 [Bacteroidia bacterium]